jgi:hypothetical protein
VIVSADRASRQPASSPRNRALFHPTALAVPEELEVVVRDAELVRPLDAATKSRKHVVFHKTRIDILDPSAPFTDEMVVVTSESFRQLKELDAFRHVRRAQDPEITQELDGPVDGHDTHLAILQSPINLRD